MSLVTFYALIVLGLLLKHYAADIGLQNDWIAINKGTWLHPAGLVHAGWHALGTIILLSLAAPFTEAPLATLVQVIAAIAVAEFGVHYFIDLGKSAIDRKAHYSRPAGQPGGGFGMLVTDTRYFALFVADQCLHFATYIAIGWAFVTYTA